MISKISTGNTIKEYYYKGAKEPVLTCSYDIKHPMQKSYEVKQYDTYGKLILMAGIDGGEISNLDIYSDQENQINHNVFVRGNEIYTNSKTKKIDLSNMSFSKELVPFIWDKELSEGTDQAYISYSNPAETDNIAHTITYKIFEKGNPGNRIEIVNAPGENEKGYWYRYLNNKIYQERYIANKTDLSDFGHLYDYDKQGRLLSNTYGYFEKITGGVYMQRREISYDNYGNMVKVRDLAEHETSFDINYSYEYDQHKNWTVRVEKYKDGSGSSVTRKLEYYTSNESPVTNNLSDADYVVLLAKASEQAKIAEQKYKEYLSAKGKPANASMAPVAGTTGWRVFLPAGQVLDTLSYGDLNKDGLEDVVIVFQPKKALQHQRNTTRELRILFKQQDGNYLLAATSSHAAMPEGDGNIFFSGTEIKNGILIVEHEFLRGGCTYKYRYQNGGFYLIGASSITGDPTYSKTFDYNLSTGRYVSEYTNDDDDTKSVKKEGVHKLNTLPKIENFELFSIEVEGERI
ncbi:hypothetical protein [Chitinophaga sp. CF118]|uniref:hypothetical protein n=1 Tax=Chitinophaga sp. CF118 TaxID=1884367 RepID=UPI000B7F03E4|nr:hypothetical protein [Chitinophaga sp. CF118]